MHGELFTGPLQSGGESKHSLGARYATYAVENIVAEMIIAVVRNVWRIGVHFDNLL